MRGVEIPPIDMASLKFEDSTTNLSFYRNPVGLALNHVDLDGFDAHADFFEPLDGGFDVGAFTIEFEADDADFIGDAGLADVGDDWKFMGELPEERFLDELRRIHQPQTRLLSKVTGVEPFGGRFLFGSHNEKSWSSLRRWRG